MPADLKWRKKKVSFQVYECCFSKSTAVCHVEASQAEGLWGRDPETEKHREAETQRDGNMKTTSLPLQLPIRAVEKWRSPVWKCILLGECAVSAFFPTPVSLLFSNHSITEPMPVPRIHRLMNRGDYSRRVWSVSSAMSLHCDRAHDVCHFPTEEALKTSDSLRFIQPEGYTTLSTSPMIHCLKLGRRAILVYPRWKISHMNTEILRSTSF